jgi:hypothetical protein
MKMGRLRKKAAGKASEFEESAERSEANPEECGVLWRTPQ